MKNKGFTLIELIAVIVVIVILAAIALPRIGDMRSAAQGAQESASKATIQTAIERAITEGAIPKATAASDVAGILFNNNSTLTGVPFVTSTNGVTVGGVYPAYTVSVDPASSDSVIAVISSRPTRRFVAGFFISVT